MVSERLSNMFTGAGVTVYTPITCPSFSYVQVACVGPQDVSQFPIPLPFH